jgi:DMSO/TMAO reductase YedYZ molybdopterin-dependent catalytic subunit
MSGGGDSGAGGRRVPRENVGARRVGRLGFVGVVGVGVATLFYGEAISRVVGKVTGPLSSATGLSGLLPSGGWQIYTVAATMPTFDPVSWRLRVGGLAGHPFELSYDELVALPKSEQVSNFHCVTGWEVRNVRWGGVRLSELLRRASPWPQAHALHFVSSEKPYDDFLEMSQATLPDVMLAYEMNGEPLRREHGAPVRLVIPEMYGYKNVKWVERIDLVSESGQGYWEQDGYDNDAWVGRSNGYGAA